MNFENNKFREKYLKYKSKYFNLKYNLLHGGVNTIPIRNDETMLIFIKKIVEENAKIRFSSKPDFKTMIANIMSVDDIRKFTEHRFNIILTKGFERLFRLIDYISTDKEFDSKSNNCKSLIVAQFIIINQVFGDGNHRTALYVLHNYSTYSEDEIKIIMGVSERIHRWDGDLKHLWYGIDAEKIPNFSKLYDNPHISALLKK